MAVMTHEYSNFPDQVYNLHHFENVANAPSDVISVITEIKNLISEGSYSAAVALLENRKNILSPYWIDADNINAIEEEIRNLEIYAKSQKQAYYYQEDEPDATEGDVWIQ